MPSSYRSVDHVMLRLDAVEPLFRRFSETFGLPVAWPLQRTDFATYGGSMRATRTWSFGQPPPIAIFPPMRNRP
ncbi:hypothetical protein [Acidovorax sp. ACV01]|uniref:hypothetical protein n=1 Tax=Acidovorax sp. ACV01 TaxID=2769311 RepID=UPI001CE13E4F|nr:hypothetical protein [Acidovorax sp. ACV01]